ncbi:oligosaccharide flippase family protein [Actinoplanes sp. LDG1-06]|uniref:Oligosaccharide flippase family protein n=1 Tax=Paractinoplanes ovalisporus TaxID=2810368 RepID=A0ABS2ATU3_9ACTN|nr:oligosaccharide flippase family protein [Actinoplanes ovalisporus]MBM2623293.1 oligosaccharide flippase family protein [Actinoplanes ovalisporus]
MSEVALREAPPRRPGPAGWVSQQLREPYVQLFASQLLTGGVAFVANILMVRALAPAHRGEVALMLQVVYLATQFMLLGTERSFVANYHEAAPGAAVRAYGKLLIVPCAVGLLLAGAYEVIAPAHYNPGLLVIGLIAAYTLVEVAGLATRSIAIAAGRVGDFLVCRVVEAILLLALLVVLYLANTTTPAVWIVAYLIAGLLPTVVYIVLWLRSPGAALSDHNRAVRREGLSLFPAAISNMAMLRSDRLALPALASTSALGIYTAVATMTELLAWPVRAYADAKLGKWRKDHNNGRLPTRPILLAVAAYCLVVAPIAAGALYLLIVPVFGHEYAQAKSVVVPLVAAAGLYAVSRVTLGLLIAKGRGSLVSAAEITGFVVSFAAYLLLIPPFGILGAAYGSLVGYGSCLLFALVTNQVTGDRE